MYGFIHGRFMSLEGGDFTWEDEYVGVQSWPMSEATTVRFCNLFCEKVLNQTCPFQYQYYINYTGIFGILYQFCCSAQSCS